MLVLKTDFRPHFRSTESRKERLDSTVLGHGCTLRFLLSCPGMGLKHECVFKLLGNHVSSQG